jgi:hypothetical protein
LNQNREVETRTAQLDVWAAWLVMNSPHRTAKDTKYFIVKEGRDVRYAGKEWTVERSTRNGKFSMRRHMQHLRGLVVEGSRSTVGEGEATTHDI